MVKPVKISFKGLDVGLFSNFLSIADIQQELVLDFRHDKLISRAHPGASRAFINARQLTMSDFVNLEKPENFQRLKLPLSKLKTLKDTIELYQSSGFEKIKGYFNCEETGVAGVYVGLTLHLSTEDDKMKIKVPCTDLDMVSYMPDEAWTKYSCLDNIFMRFDVDKATLFRVKKLFGIENSAESSNKTKDPQFVITTDGTEITFSSRDKSKWSYTLPSGINKEINITDKDRKDKDGNISIVIDTKLIYGISSEMVTIYLVHNEALSQGLCLAWENADNVFIVPWVPHDPNVK